MYTWCNKKTLENNFFLINIFNFFFYISLILTCASRIIYYKQIYFYLLILKIKN